MATITRSTSRPGVRSTCRTVATKRPAPTTSTSASANCAVTSRRRIPPPEGAANAASCRRDGRAARRRYAAGPSPLHTPASSVSAPTRTKNGAPRNSSPPAIGSSPPTAMPTPAAAAPHAPAAARCSSRNCTNTRARVAPSCLRTANSPARSSTWIDSRTATFRHVTRSISPPAAASQSTTWPSRVPARDAPNAGTRLRPRPAPDAPAPMDAPDVRVAISACASRSVKPSRGRPIVRSHAVFRSSSRFSPVKEHNAGEAVSSIQASTAAEPSPRKPRGATPTTT